MKEKGNSEFSKILCRAALLMVAVGIAAAPAVYAKPNSKRAPGQPPNMVAHVPLSGGSVTRMLLVKKSGKEYLVLGLDSAAQVAILDVSEPGQPRLVDTAEGSAGPPSTEVKLVADTLKFFGTSDAESVSSSGPKEIRSLSGVTTFMKDKARGLIYVANGEGLWIVKTKQKADADAITDNYGG
jgi:hypothetical protein